MTAEQIQQASIGEWQSIAPEVRPGAQKNPDGTIKPFYLARQFKYEATGIFELVVTSFADPYGKVGLMKMTIRGHITWQGPHPIAEGAQKVDFTADEVYTVTPLVQGSADVLNQFTQGFEKWEPGREQSILGKVFPPFGLAEGQLFKEYDLMYIYDDLMFWGARNVDGRGFDTEANRPSNLQIPMVRAGR
ncbi:MAG: hypothetical protein QM731_07140 [Chitinophagaceae bacterium]